MTGRLAVPASPAFDAIARGAQFRDLIAIVVKASPDVIFRALHEVTLRDMKLAWLLGELRYLPSRLAGRMPATDSTRPFLSMLLEGGTLVLRDEAPREVITGSAAQLHRVHQAPQRFASREAFEAFTDPDAVLSASTIVLQPLSTHGQFTWNFLLGSALWAVVAVVARVRRGDLPRRPVQPAVGHIS